MCRKSRNYQLTALLVLGRPWRAYRHLFHGTRSPVAGQWVSDTFFKLFSFPCQRPKSEANDKQKKNDDVETLSGSMRATFVHFRYEVPIDIGSRLGV